MRNAISQDAGLGRGTESRYLDILNHLSLQYDENAPTQVSDQTMRKIGPDNKTRQLESEWSALEAVLTAKYGKSTKATGADGENRKKKQNEVRTARQRLRRRILNILRKNYFEQRNTNELDRQRGIHHPQQPLQKVHFSLPERRVLAEILGDLDESLPEDRIVRRKVEAINAWIKYAWQIEPRQPAPSRNPTSQALPEPSTHRQTHTPQPRYISMIKTPVAPMASINEAEAMILDGPLPSEANTIRSSGTVMPGRTKQKPAVNCFFCRRTFTRRTKAWNCEQRHLQRRTSERIHCPDPDCKTKGVLMNEFQLKNHAQFDHGHIMRKAFSTEVLEFKPFEKEIVSPMGQPILSVPEYSMQCEQSIHLPQQASDPDFISITMDYIDPAIRQDAPESPDTAMGDIGLDIAIDTNITEGAQRHQTT